MYANIVGLGETKGFWNDAFTLSDENIDTAIDFGVNIALGVISLGAGTALMV